MAEPEDSVSVCAQCHTELREELICPICHKSLCSDHIMPDNHHCQAVKKMDTGSIFNVIIVLLVIAAIALSVYFIIKYAPELDLDFSLSGRGDNTSRLVNRTITEEVPVEIDFQEYMLNPEEYYNEEATILGYLTTEEINNGYFSYVSDDFDNKIQLSIIKDNAKNAFEARKEGEVYNVRGILRRKRDGLYMDVDSITRGRKPTKTIEKIITEEVT